MFQSSRVRGCLEVVATLSGTLWLEDGKTVILLCLPVLGCHFAADSSELTVHVPSILPNSFQNTIGTSYPQATALPRNVMECSGVLWCPLEVLSTAVPFQPS